MSGTDPEYRWFTEQSEVQASGVRWVVTPTTDWSPPAPEPFAWAAYVPHGDGSATRSGGFAASKAAAVRAAKHAVALGWVDG